MTQKLCLAVALGIFVSLALFGGLLVLWALPYPTAFLAVCRIALPLLLIGSFGTQWSTYQLFIRRPNYLPYGGL